MKLNSGGLKLCVAYLVFVILMLVWIYFTPNPKSRFSQATLTWLPGHLTLAPLDSYLNLYPFMWRHPWTEVLVQITSFSVVYLIGWGISAVKRKLS